MPEHVSLRLVHSDEAHHTEVRSAGTRHATSPRTSEDEMKLYVLATNLSCVLLACAHTNDQAKETSITGSTWQAHDDGAREGTPNAGRNDAGAWADATGPTATPEPTSVFPRPVTAGGTDTSTATANTPAPSGGATPASNGGSAANGTGTNSGTAATNGTGPTTSTSKSSPTVLAQGNSKPELDLTASIRRQIMKNATLGFNAKNVKVITQGTKVTLRGRVDSAQERDIIDMQARQTPGVMEVDNQIDVKK